MHTIGLWVDEAMARRQCWARTGICTALVIGVGACGGDASNDGSMTGPASGASIEVSAGSDAVEVGATLQLTAVMKDASGATMEGRPVSWSSPTPGIATVSGSGLVTGIAPGGVDIAATAEGRMGTFHLTVRFAPVASVVVTPEESSLLVGENVQLEAALKDASGAPVAGPVTWTSDREDVATVSAWGRVTGHAPGVATISARHGETTSTAFVTVTAPAVASVHVSPSSGSTAVGGTIQLAAVARDSAGDVLSGRTVSWTSTVDQIATVSPVGLVTGHSEGSTTIIATIGGVAGSADLAVTGAPVAAIQLTPTSRALMVGETHRFTATVRDAAGNVLPGRSVTWTVNVGGIVAGTTSDAHADLQGVALGEVILYATSEGVSNFALIRVWGPLTCATIAGGQIQAQDGQYLGRLTNQYDSESVLNSYGSYGSRYSSTSIYNPYGSYGSPYATLSAYNPYSSSPPRLMVNGFHAAYITKNTYQWPQLDPDFLKSCSFP